MTDNNILGLGKDQNNINTPIGIAGENNNELKIKSMDNINLYYKILKEIKKFNIQLEIVTNMKLTNEDVEYHK